MNFHETLFHTVSWKRSTDTKKIDLVIQEKEMR